MAGNNLVNLLIPFIRVGEMAHGIRLKLLDKEVRRLGVPRQSIIKVWRAERIEKAS